MLRPVFFLFCNLLRLKFRRSLSGKKEPPPRIPGQEKCEILKIARILLLNTPVFSGKGRGETFLTENHVHEISVLHILHHMDSTALRKEAQPLKSISAILFLCDLLRIKFRRSLPGNREPQPRISGQEKCEILKTAGISLLNTPVFWGKSREETFLTENLVREISVLHILHHMDSKPYGKKRSHQKQQV